MYENSKARNNLLLDVRKGWETRLDFFLCFKCLTKLICKKIKYCMPDKFQCYNVLLWVTSTKLYFWCDPRWMWDVVKVHLADCSLFLFFLLFYQSAFQFSSHKLNQFSSTTDKSAFIYIFCWFFLFLFYLILQWSAMSHGWRMLRQLMPQPPLQHYLGKGDLIQVNFYSFPVSDTIL